MTKKDYVLALLKKLEPYRDVLTGIIAMIEFWECSDEDVDTLIQMIEEQMKNVTDEKLKEKFHQAQNLLVHLKEKEIIAHKQDQADANALLAQIASL